MNNIEERSRTRQRGSNLTVEEKENLVSAVETFKTKLENKKTDNSTNEDKEKAWKKITQIFNAQSSTYRSTETLKTFCKNLKKKLKKKTAEHKKELYLTGGGPAPPDLTPTEEKLLTIVNIKSIYGLKNPHDSDGNADMTDPSTSKNSVNLYSSSSSESTYLLEQDNENESSGMNEGMKVNWKNYKMKDLKRPLSSGLKWNKEEAFTNRDNVEIINESKDRQADDMVTTASNKGKGNKNGSLEKKEKEKTKKPLDRRRPTRRPQSTIRALTSSVLGEKYMLLADKKIMLVEKLTEEHNLRMEAVKLEIENKKKMLNNN